MDIAAIGLAAGEFNQVFPFHLVFSEDMRLVQIGPALARVFPHLQVGAGFTACFRIKRPTTPVSFASIRQQVHTLFILEPLAGGLVLRGQMLPLASRGLIAFLGTPWLTSLQQLSLHGLSLADFAVHDSIADLLTMLQSQQMALADSDRLAAKLVQQRAALVEVNHQLERKVAQLGHAEAALRASEERFRTLATHAPVGILQSDPDGRILFMNDRWMAITGMRSIALDGPWWQHLLNPKDDGALFARFRLSMLAGEEITEEHRLWRCDGSYAWASLSAIALHDQAGVHCGYLATLIDITERKHADMALRMGNTRLEAIIENMQGGVLVEDSSGNIVIANHVFCRLFNIAAAPEQLIGVDCRDSLDQLNHLFNDPASFAQRISELVRAGQLVVAEELALADGRTFTRDYVPIYLDGAYHGHLWQYRDISERKHVEAMLAESRDAALESSRLKSEFLAMVSHEIRTPMNGVIGMTELLLDTSLDEEQREFAQTISASAQVLMGIINDILDYSKIEAGKLLLDSTDTGIADLVGSVQRILANAMRAKDLAFVAEIGAGVPPFVRADEGRLRQVLLNLASNAVKFTPAGDIRVQIELTEEAADSATLRFSVSDTGIGIPEHLHDQLFQPFTQADSSVTRRYGGTGLGLAICKSMVDLMGGTIGCRSTPGEGSTFWFCVRLLKAAGRPTDRPAPAAAGANTRRSLTGGRILLVEDHPVNRTIAMKQLAKLGYTTDTVDDGRAAVGLLATEASRYQLVLMDCHMPGMDGYTASRLIREMERGSGEHIPIVAMTASALESDREACLAAGMDDFLSKPIRQDALHALIQRWIREPATPASPARPAPPDTLLDPVVLAELRAMDGEDRGFLAELVGIFRQDIQTCIPKMHAAIANGEAGTLREIAHGLAGVSVNLASLPLAAELKQAELMAEEGKVAQAAALMPQIERLIDRSLESLESVCSQLKHDLRRTAVTQATDC